MKYPMPEGQPQYPSKREMLRQAYLTAKQIYQDPRPTPKGLKEKRMDVCHQCEWFDPQQQRCKKCGCYLVAKASVIGAKCPLGLWDGLE